MQPCTNPRGIEDSLGGRMTGDGSDPVVDGHRDRGQK